MTFSARTAYALCTLGMVIVGSSVATSRAIIDYPLLTGQAMRYAVAAVLLFGLARLLPPPARSRPTGRDLGLLIGLGVTGLALFNVCVLVGLRHAEPAVIGTAVGAAPLALAVLGPLIARRRPAGRLVVAAAVVVAGTALVEGFGRTDGIGLAAAAGALACETAFSLLAAPMLDSLGAVLVSAYSCLLAVPVLLAGALILGETAVWRLPSLSEAAALAYLAVFVTVAAFLAWFLGLQRLGVERAGIIVGVLPLATLATTVLMDRHLPPAAATAGVVIVAAGLALPHLKLRKPYGMGAGGTGNGARCRRMNWSTSNEQAGPRCPRPRLKRPTSTSASSTAMS